MHMQYLMFMLGSYALTENLKLGKINPALLNQLSRSSNWGMTSMNADVCVKIIFSWLVSLGDH